MQMEDSEVIVLSPSLIWKHELVQGRQKESQQAVW